MQYAVISGVLAVAQTAAADEDAVASAPPDAVTYPLAPRPPVPPAFGGRGRVVLSLAGGEITSRAALGAVGGVAAFGASLGPISYSSWRGTFESGFGPRTTTSYRRLGFTPSVDVFVSDRFSVGGTATLSWASSSTGGSDATSTAVGLAPRIGYVVPLSSSFAFWPRGGIGVELTDLDSQGTVQRNRTYFVQGTFGLVARVSDHLVIDLGPTLTARTIEGLTYSGTHVDADGRVALRLDF